MDSTGDHAERAAAKAIELAAELVIDPDGTVRRKQLEAAVHLTYMAGLLRGGTAGPPVESDRCRAWLVSRSGTQSTCELSAGHASDHSEGVTRWAKHPTEDS